MAKTKIYDIIPPKKRSQYLKKQKTEEKKIPTKIKKYRPKGLSKRNTVIVLVAVFLGLAIYWGFSTASSVIIEIWPSVFPVDFVSTVSFSTAESDFELPKIELSAPVISAELLETEKTFSMEFPSSAVESKEKATGIIKVYSKASRNITLVEGTRFLSSSEPTLQFHTQKRITVPAGGEIDVSVIASEAGEDYNIEPCSFSIPGLRNSSPPQLYYDVFGKSLESMSGGSTEATKKISQEDVDSASDQILKIAEQEVISSLGAQVGNDYRILDKSVKIEILSEGLVDATIGQQKDGFIYQITVKATTLGVKSEYLRKFAQKYLLASVPGNKSFQEDNFNIEFLPSTFATETDEQGNVIVSADISISSNIYSQVDIESIKEIAKNRNKKSISRYTIEIYPEIKRQPRILFSPLWVRKSGLVSENIEVKLKFD
ncbi:hypothetical protein KKC63_00140 [Patescibacteria group bacterium]|nr:hypothetical protein [Patescibacteria group bacterium]MBU4023435.1 hypothetical protein [Patescibacteria group bacterium]